MHFYQPADPQPCHYCKIIEEFEEDYPIREGIFTNEQIIFRCAWHAKFECSVCNEFHHFSWLYYCPKTEMLICGSCNSPTLKPIKFWNKTYAFAFWCKDCEETHYDLMFMEYRGTHPWQTEKLNITSNIDVTEPWEPYWEPSHIRQGREISVQEALRVEDRTTSLKNLLWGERVHQSEFVPMSQIRIEDTQEKWERNSKYLIEFLETSEEDTGDMNRQFVVDPAFWELIGDVSDLEVLDAGCGNGYFTRELARRGANAIGVDFSKTFIDYCKKKEESEKLGCDFIQTSLVDLSDFEDQSFDLVVSNIVMVDIPDFESALKEIGRVTKENGRFVWSNTHPVFARHSALELKLPSDTKRNEERMYRIIDRYFETGGTQVQWFGEVPLWQFDRTLSEYSKGLKNAGFVIREIVEPRPNIKTMETYPALFAFDDDRYPFFIIFDCLKI